MAASEPEAAAEARPLTPAAVVAGCAVPEARPSSSSSVSCSPRSLLSTSVFRSALSLLVPLPRLPPASQRPGEGFELELSSPRQLKSELFTPPLCRVSPAAAAAADAALSAAAAAPNTPPCADPDLSGLHSSLRFLSRASSSLPLVPPPPPPPPPPRPFACRFATAFAACTLPFAWSDESVGSGLVIAAATAARTAAAALELKLVPPAEGWSLSEEDDEEELVSTTSVRQEPYLGRAGGGADGSTPFCRVLRLFFALAGAAAAGAAAARGGEAVLVAAAAVAAATAAEAMPPLLLMLPLPLPLPLLLLADGWNSHDRYLQGIDGRGGGG